MTAQETKEKILSGEIYPLINEQIDGHNIVCKKDFLLADISFILMITHRKSEQDILNKQHVNILSISFDNKHYYQIYESIVPYYIHNIYLADSNISIPLYSYNKLSYPELNINLLDYPVLMLSSSKLDPFIFIAHKTSSELYNFVASDNFIEYSQVEKTGPMYELCSKEIIEEDGTKSYISYCPENTLYGYFKNEI